MPERLGLAEDGGALKLRPPPTGHVRKTAGHYQAAREADGFEGLARHPKQLLEPLRRCGVMLPFPRRALDTLTLLFDFSRPADWAADRPPMVYPGNAEIAGCLGLSERTVRNHLHALEAAGAIAIVRGPGNRRTPIRDHSGRITEWYGINLAPMAALSARLNDAADALRQRRRQLRAIMRQAMTAVQEIRVGADAVAVIASDCPASVDDRDLAELQHHRASADATMAQLQRAAASDPGLDKAAQGANAAHIEQATRDLVALASATAEQAHQLLVRATGSNEKTEDSGSPEIHDPISLQDISNDTKDRYQACKTQEVQAVAANDPPAPHRYRQELLPDWQESDSAAGASRHPEQWPVKWHHIGELYPAFSDIMRDYLLIADGGSAPVDAFISGGRILAGQLGVSDWCWAQGCRNHGRVHAALSAIVAAAKPIHEIRKSRSALLSALLLRPPGELNALASFHALRKRRGG